MLSKAELLTRFAGFPDITNIEKFPKYHEFDIYFEKLSMDGLEEMHRYSTDPRLYEFFEFDVFKDISDTKEYINKLLTRMSKKGKYRTASYWFIRRKTDNFLLGSACLVNLNYQRQSIELGYGMDPKVWGMGYILQVQEILKMIVFDVLKLNRLGGLTSIKNKNTINSVLASGFLKEGVIKDYMIIDNEYHDGWMYGLLAKDYFSTNSIVSKLENKETISMQMIADIIGNVLNQTNIDENDDMTSVTNWDSLNHINIILTLQEKTGYQFLPLEISQATSIDALFKIINSKNMR